MITIQTDTEIDVISKERELVAEASGAGGILVQIKGKINGDNNSNR